MKILYSVLLGALGTLCTVAMAGHNPPQRIVIPLYPKPVIVPVYVPVRPAMPPAQPMQPMQPTQPSPQAPAADPLYQKQAAKLEPDAEIDNKLGQDVVNILSKHCADCHDSTAKFPLFVKVAQGEALPAFDSKTLWGLYGMVESGWMPPSAQKDPKKVIPYEDRLKLLQWTVDTHKRNKVKK